MEKNFLKNFVAKMSRDNLGEHRDIKNMWYNETGDCIQFQVEQVAIVAERVDDYLTIYRSAEDEKPIGFQLKDVKALINKYKYSGIFVKTTVRSENNELISVTALLINTLTESIPSINRREAYTEAIKALAKEDNVAVRV